MTAYPSGDTRFLVAFQGNSTRQSRIGHRPSSANPTDVKAPSSAVLIYQGSRCLRKLILIFVFPAQLLTVPSPGEQHLNSGGRTITNPFEEVKPRISEYTAQEIATLQSRLEKQLGPEYISSRAGPSGQKVHYVAAEKCIQLANEVFGFNGWSSQIMDVQVDFIDENPQTLKVSLGLSVIVRVTLKDGTYHEDVGYGHMENSKGKAAAFEKAKKEGTTDALKRALKNFGNLLGLCIYDKEYLQKVTKVKAQPTKWDVEKLHRHSTFEPPVKKEEKPVEEKSQNGATGASICKS